MADERHATEKDPDATQATAKAILEDYQQKLGENFLHFLHTTHTINQETQTVAHRLGVAVCHQNKAAQDLRQDLLQSFCQQGGGEDPEEQEKVRSELDGLCLAHCASLLHVIVGVAQGMAAHCQWLQGAAVQDLQHLRGTGGSFPGVGLPQPADPSSMYSAHPETGAISPPPSPKEGCFGVQGVTNHSGARFILPSNPPVALPCAPQPQGYAHCLQPLPFPPFLQPPPFPYLSPPLPFSPTMHSHQSVPVPSGFQFQGPLTVPMGYPSHLHPSLPHPIQPPSPVLDTGVGANTPPSPLPSPEGPCLPFFQPFINP